jgi:hypothetical protein
VTKKDYQKAAEMIRDTIKIYGDDVFTKLMIESFVRFFKGDNPLFDEVRFRKACKQL